MSSPFSSQWLRSSLCAAQAVALGLVAFVVIASSSARADEGGFRPDWTSSRYDLPENFSFLYSSQNPNFVSPAFGTQILGQGQINELKQDYNDLNRDYDMRQSYGIATQNDEINHEQSMKDMGRVVLYAARTSQTQQYAKNAEQAQKNGEISKPLVYVGGAAAFGMGTPVDVKLGNDTKATWHGDAMQRHGQLDLQASDLMTSVEMNGLADAPEHYLVRAGKPLILGLNSGLTYGGTSNSLSASLSHSIGDHLGASVETTRPTGANSAVLPEETVNLSYGLNF